MKVSQSFQTHQREAYSDLSRRRDQLYQWLQWHQPARDQISLDLAVRPTQCHHIHGRGPKETYHWFTNLLTVSIGCHTWIHDASPLCGEIACLRSKMALEISRRQNGDPLPSDESKRIWMPEAMACNIGRPSLSARVHELLGRINLPGSKIEQYGMELLAFLG